MNIAEISFKSCIDRNLENLPVNENSIGVSGTPLNWGSFVVGFFLLFLNGTAPYVDII